MDRRGTARPAGELPEVVEEEIGTGDADGATKPTETAQGHGVVPAKDGVSEIAHGNTLMPKPEIALAAEER